MRWLLRVWGGSSGGLWSWMGLRGRATSRGCTYGEGTQPTPPLDSCLRRNDGVGWDGAVREGLPDSLGYSVGVGGLRLFVGG